MTHKNNTKYHKERRHNDKEFRDRTNRHHREAKERRRLKLIDYYSEGKNRCACCGEENLRMLTLDHINNDGYKIRYKDRYTEINRTLPADIQVLCYNCNCGRQNNKYICPHEQETVIMEEV